MSFVTPPPPPPGARQASIRPPRTALTGEGSRSSGDPGCGGLCRAGGWRRGTREARRWEGGCSSGPDGDPPPGPRLGGEEQDCENHPLAPSLSGAGLTQATSGGGEQSAKGPGKDTVNKEPQTRWKADLHPWTGDAKRQRVPRVGLRACTAWQARWSCPRNPTGWPAREGGLLTVPSRWRRYHSERAASGKALANAENEAGKPPGNHGVENRYLGAWKSAQHKASRTTLMHANHRLACCRAPLPSPPTLPEVCTWTAITTIYRPSPATWASPTSRGTGWQGPEERTSQWASPSQGARVQGGGSQVRSTANASREVTRGRGRGIQGQQGAPGIKSSPPLPQATG